MKGVLSEEKLKLQDSSFLPKSQSRAITGSGALPHYPITIQKDGHAERTSRKSRHERAAPAKWALRVGRDKYRSSRTPIDIPLDADRMPGANQSSVVRLLTRKESPYGFQI